MLRRSAVTCATMRLKYGFSISRESAARQPGSVKCASMSLGSPPAGAAAGAVVGAAAAGAVGGAAAAFGFFFIIICRGLTRRFGGRKLREKAAAERERDRERERG
eukprot:COSAG02_NODE_23051_length_731_cov_1.449367_1_plen_104_part_10